MNNQLVSSLEGDVVTVEVVQTTPDSQLVAQNNSNNNLRGEVLTALPIALSVFGVIAIIWFINSFLQICKPNEVLILSGRKRKNKDGHELGYRVIFGGRTLCIPILETVKTMDLTTMPVPVEVTNAYSRGGTPLNIQAIANVKISNDPTIVGNAIERFLDRDRSEIVRVARETLEGNLRGVVSTLTPEQLNEDRLQFAERIAEDVSRDLSKLGLQLDTLKIQSVSDDVDYLSSIGRRQIAMIARDAEVAESNAVAEAEQTEADCKREAEVVKTQAQTTVQQKQNELRKIQAELEQQARSEEERTIAAAKEARARAEQQLQTIRAELERLRLEVDQVLPAEAQRQAQELNAKGEAAPVLENARATAQVNDLLSAVWQETGKDAAELFYLQQIEMILQEAAKIPGRVDLKQVNVIDNGDGKSIANLVNAYPEIFRQFLQNVDQTLGIHLTGSCSETNGKVPPQLSSGVNINPER
ncbi:MAG: flotillin family protein [Microcoleaceae cyanobacterium]